VGSQIDPDDIANPHIRAHALEGRLFRSTVEQALQGHEIRTEVLLERDAYARVAARLKRSTDNVKRAIQDLGRSAPTLRVTPAMEAGVTDHVWDLEEVIALLPK
jgi:hypothetical protein